MSDTQAMKLKIQKLLAMANGSENENEAAAFLSKAEALMEEYQLSEWECSSADDAMGFSMMLKGSASSPTWQRHLICALAVYYGCTSVRRSGLMYTTRTGMMFDGFEIDIIGRESSRITVELMYPFVLQQTRAAGAKLKAQGHGGSKDQLVRRVANALTSRIYKLHRERSTETITTRTDAMRRDRALVVVNEVKAFIADQYGVLGKGRARARSTTEAARDAASGISIERAVRGSSQLKLA